MAQFKLNRGYDIRLAGETQDEVAVAAVPTRVALKPVEFRGIKPRLAVGVGDDVKIGSTLFYDKKNEEHRFGSPASGKVVAINRGRRRVITSIVIEPNGKNDAVEFTSYNPKQIATLKSDVVHKQIADAGLFGVFIQRPFGNTADPTVTPRDIFVNTFSTAPLAPDTVHMMEGNEAYYEAGIDVCSKLTSGNVHIALNGNVESLPPAFAFSDAKNVKVHQFRGPHPAGNVGTLIHKVAPISGRRDIVWTINLQGVIALGKLFVQGRYPTERIVSVAGSSAKNRKYFRTVVGAPIDALVQGDVEDTEVRYISGDVLSGRKESAEGFVGFNDNMVTLIPEAIDPEFIGWMLPGHNKESYHKSFMSQAMPWKKFAIDTRLGGGHRAMVATGYYEQVTPLDILPMFLIKSIMAEDFDEMEGLGLFELLEEDLALCEYICPSKTEMQTILRQGLDLMEKEG